MGEGIYNPRRARPLGVEATHEAAIESARCSGVELDCVVELKGEAEQAMVREVKRPIRSRAPCGRCRGSDRFAVAQLLPIVVTPHRFRTKR